MKLAVHVLLAVAACLIGLSDTAQARHRHRPVYMFMPLAPVVTPMPPPRLPLVDTGVINQPGVPNTSRPGTIGTGALPSGLKGDSPTAPGFPGWVGRD